MTQLGDLVYYRTYSRYLPDEKRREYWWETVARAVDYNCSLIPTTREEAEKNLQNFLKTLEEEELYEECIEVVNLLRDLDKIKEAESEICF